MNTDPLFEPFQLGSLKLRNRVAMAPMTRNFSAGNQPDDALVEYYRRRAEGGVGLIITEGTTINHPAAHHYDKIPFFHGEALTGWKKVVDAVHGAGGAIFPQLWHVGAERESGDQPHSDVPAMSPSGLTAPDKPSGVAMTKRDIDAVIAAFTDAAGDAQRLGFDGVELHAAHGYLLDQFFWEGTNQRTDEYGGTPAKRQRMVIETIQAVRERVGPDFPIMLRFSQWKVQDFSAKMLHTPDELERFLLPLSEAGVDLFHASNRRFWEPEFEGSTLNLAGWTQKLTGKPTMTVGSVGLTEDFITGIVTEQLDTTDKADLGELVQRMANGEFDLVAVGRALLQDPEWLQKVKDGRFDEIEPFEKTSLEKLW